MNRSYLVDRDERIAFDEAVDAVTDEYSDVLTCPVHRAVAALQLRGHRDRGARAGSRIVFILDDLLLRPIISVANVIHSMAIEELYDVQGIQDEIKENRLLFEIGDRDVEEYERRQDELRTQLDVAREARATLSGKVEVKR